MSELHALLVGIDRYEPDRFADDRPIFPLEGCVRDVRRLERFLRSEPVGLPAARLRKLVSPADPASVAPDERLATRRALLEEIRALGERAAPGDTVLVHYSGHGLRVPTALPEVKGREGWDECLLPCDFATAGVVRDIEVHALAWELAERGVLGTWVFDACHSGGIFRGELDDGKGGGAVRSLGTLASPSLAAQGGRVAGLERLEALWRRAARPSYRTVHASSGWFPPPRNCALLAACGPHQLARELNVDGVGRCGALTHFLLDVVSAPGFDGSLRELHRAVSARMHTRCAQQTPVLEGDADRVFLGAGRRLGPAVQGWSVLEVVDSDPSRVLLGTGWFHGTGVGARFTAAQTRSVGAGPIAEVVEGGPTACWARLREPRSSSVAVGSLLYLEDPGPRARRWTVSIPGRSEGTQVEECLAAVRASLPRRLPIPLDRAARGEEADFRIGVIEGTGLIVLDRHGRAVPDQGPAIQATEPEASVRLLRRLEHLACYFRVRELTRGAVEAPLEGQLRAEIFAVPAGALPGDPSERRALDGPAAPDDLLHLSIANLSRTHLNVSVLDLQPDWGIARVHPGPDQGAWDLLEAGAELVVPLVADLPDGMEAGRDLLMVLASTGPLDVSTLELPALAEASSGPVPASPSAVGGVHASRTVRRPPQPTEPWAVAWVELELMRPRVAAVFGVAP